MLVRLLGSEVIQRPHVLRGARGTTCFIKTQKQSEDFSICDEAACSSAFSSAGSASTHSFFDDVEALLVNLKGGHLLDDLLQQDVLLVVVTFD